MSLHGLKVTSVFNGDNRLRHQTVQQGAFNRVEPKRPAPQDTQDTDESALVYNGNTVITLQMMPLPPIRVPKPVVLKDVGDIEDPLMGGNPAVWPFTERYGFDGTVCAHEFIREGNDIQGLLRFVRDA